MAAKKTKRRMVTTKGKKPVKKTGTTGNNGGKCAAFSLPINARLAAKLAFVATEKGVRGGAKGYAMNLIREAVPA